MACDAICCSDFLKSWEGWEVLKGARRNCVNPLIDIWQKHQKPMTHYKLDDFGIRILRFKGL